MFEQKQKPIPQNLNKFVGKKIESTINLAVTSDSQNQAEKNLTFKPDNIKQPINLGLKGAKKMQENSDFQNTQNVILQSNYQEENNTIGKLQTKLMKPLNQNYASNTNNHKQVQNQNKENNHQYSDIEIQKKNTKNVEEIVKLNNKIYSKNRQQEENEKKMRIQQQKLQKEKIKQQQEEIRKRNQLKTQKMKEHIQTQQQQYQNVQKSHLQNQNISQNQSVISRSISQKKLDGQLNDKVYRSASKIRIRTDSVINQRTNNHQQQIKPLQNQNQNIAKNSDNQVKNENGILNSALNKLREEYSKGQKNKHQQIINQIHQNNEIEEKESEQQKLERFKEQTKQRVKLAQLKKKAQEEEKKKLEMQKQIKQMDLHQKAQESVKLNVLKKQIVQQFKTQSTVEQTEQNDINQKNSQSSQKSKYYKKQTLHKNNNKAPHRCQIKTERHVNINQVNINNKKQQLIQLVQENLALQNEISETENDELNSEIESNFEQDSFVQLEQELLKESQKSRNMSNNQQKQLDFNQLDRTLKVLEKKINSKKNLDEIQKELEDLMPIYQDLQLSLKQKQQALNSKQKQSHPLKKQTKNTQNNSQNQQKIQNFQSKLQQKQVQLQEELDIIISESEQLNEEGEDGISEINQNSQENTFDEYEYIKNLSPDSQSYQDDEENEEDEEIYLNNQQISQKFKKQKCNQNYQEEKEENYDFDLDIENNEQKNSDINQLLENNKLCEAKFQKCENQQLKPKNQNEKKQITKASPSGTINNYDENLSLKPLNSQYATENILSRSQSVKGILKDSFKTVQSCKQINQQNSIRFKRSKTVTFIDDQPIKDKDLQKNIIEQKSQTFQPISQNQKQKNIQQKFIVSDDSFDFSEQKVQKIKKSKQNLIQEDKNYFEDLIQDPQSQLQNLLESQKFHTKIEQNKQKYTENNKQTDQNDFINNNIINGDNDDDLNTINLKSQTNNDKNNLYNSDIDIQTYWKNTSTYKNEQQNNFDNSSVSSTDKSFSMTQSFLQESQNDKQAQNINNNYESQKFQEKQSDEKNHQEIQEINNYFDIEYDSLIFNMNSEDLLKMNNFKFKM